MQRRRHKHYVVQVLVQVIHVCHLLSECLLYKYMMSQRKISNFNVYCYACYGTATNAISVFLEYIAHQVLYCVVQFMWRQIISIIFVQLNIVIAPTPRSIMGTFRVILNIRYQWAVFILFFDKYSLLLILKWEPNVPFPVSINITFTIFDQWEYPASLYLHGAYQALPGEFLCWEKIFVFRQQSSTTSHHLTVTHRKNPCVCVSSMTIDSCYSMCGNPLDMFCQVLYGNLRQVQTDPSDYKHQHST